jgi:hypothetical protein
MANTKAPLAATTRGPLDSEAQGNLVGIDIDTVIRCAAR